GPHDGSAFEHVAGTESSNFLTQPFFLRGSTIRSEGVRWMVATDDTDFNATGAAVGRDAAHVPLRVSMRSIHRYSPLTSFPARVLFSVTPTCTIELRARDDAVHGGQEAVVLRQHR